MRDRVLCVHSGGFTSRQWRRLAAELATDFEVLTPDLIGYGAEPVWPVGKPFQFRQDVDRLEGMLGDRPVHLVGHSYGGLIVLQLALRRLGQVRSIAVFEPVTFGVLGTEDPKDLEARASIAQLRTYTPDAEGIDEEWLAGFVDWWQGPGAWLRVPAETKQAFRAVGWKLSEEVASLVADRTPAAAYSEIDAPALLLGGGKSQPAEARVLEWLEAVLPNSELRVFPEMGHMGPITHAEIVNAAIAAHVRRRPSGEIRDA